MCGEDGSDGRSRVFVVVECAILISGDEVEVAVAVQIAQRQGGPASRVDSVERIAGACLFGEDGNSGGPGVLIVRESTIIFSGDDIEIPVSIQIPQGRGSARSQINSIEGIGGTRLKSEGDGRKESPDFEGLRMPQASTSVESGVCGSGLNAVEFPVGQPISE